MLDPLAVAPAKPAVFIHKLKGRKILGLQRRGKYLIFELDSGDFLVIHLRMTGRLTWLKHSPEGVDRKYLRLLFKFGNRANLAFNDSRRFGRAFILPADAAGAFWNRLGPEPLERSFTSARLGRLLEGSGRPIKSFLLDQSKLAGVGNIYADEALFSAGIHPLRPAGRLSPRETARLSRAIKATLRQAIALKGSSVGTYRDARGARGGFQDTFKVHRREGEPCPRCRTPVQKIRVGGRGTCFCPSCQK